MKELFAFLKTNVFFAFAGTHGKELNQLSPLEGEGAGRDDILRADALRMTGTANDKAQFNVKDLATYRPNVLTTLLKEILRLKPQNDEQDLTRISNIRQGLMLKFNPFLTEARVNKTVTAISRFTSHISCKRAAFTLAEVLITLGIIGVVAAMTLPVITGKYQKVQTSVRLKKAYTTMAQALTRAQADYGDAKLWDNLTIDEESNGENVIVAEQVEKYILPYLSNVISSGLSKLGDRGYTQYLSPALSSNTNLVSLNTKYYIIEMADSTTFFMTRSSTNQLMIYCDVNGIKKNNIWGKDAFIFYIESSTGKFVPYGYTNSRATNLNGCKADGRVCAALIMQDGWEIKSDYPVNF